MQQNWTISAAEFKNSMSSRTVTAVLTVTLYYILTVKNLLRVSTRVPVHCLMYRHAQGDITLSGNRLWRFVNMCSRIMTLVFIVTLQILTVRNCTESRTDVPVHCLIHCRTLHRVGTGLWRGYWSDKGKKTKNSCGPLRGAVLAMIKLRQFSIHQKLIWFGSRGLDSKSGTRRWGSLLFYDNTILAWWPHWLYMSEHFDGRRIKS